MKVGIITFHRAINYGAVLQTLALQKTIENLNSDVEIIDYRCKTIEDDYKNFSVTKKKFLKDIINSTLSYSIRSRKKENFRRFCSEELNLSKEIYNNNDELINANNNYDIFITGSDQVWDNKCAKFDKAYFLKFVKDSKKKYSYAASFAFGEIPEGLEKEYIDRLHDFNKLSVREEKGKKIFGALLNKDIRIDLDPTLLLSKNDWESYCSEVNEKEKYILIYTVNGPKTLFKVAEKISKELGYKLIYINDSIKKKVDAYYKKGISPSEYLSLFKNAEFVLTNSFHGTVFSIIFEKRFIVESESDSGKINHRSIGLLNMVGLDNRLLENIKNSEWKDEIDYKKVKECLNLKREDSISYLNEILK